MTAQHDVVFLLDCDNTLFDNDQLETDLGDHFVAAYGAASRDRYWELLEQLRSEVGYADYLGALQRARQQDVSDARLFKMASFLLDYPFATRLYPGALDVIRHLDTFALTVILSDGDVVFQPRKIQHAGLWDAVEGRVLIAIHKERTLAAITARYPARHYVMIDDKLRILAVVKKGWADRVTTVFPRQGHYALDPHHTEPYPAADLTVDRIGDLVNHDFAELLAAAAQRHDRSHLRRSGLPGHRDPDGRGPHDREVRDPGPPPRSPGDPPFVLAQDSPVRMMWRCLADRYSATYPPTPTQ